jgi:hypothetical protein
MSEGSTPAYSDVPVRAEPGLSLDISPLAHMCARLVLQELVRGTGSSLESLDADLVAPVYLWANRREERFGQWPVMGASVSGMTVMRWYGAQAAARAGCSTCDERGFLAMFG